MKHFGAKRVFRDPHDLRGLPGVSKRRPIPPREKPLKGTVAMLHPKEGDMRSLVAGTTLAVSDSMAMRRFGWGVFAAAVCGPLIYGLMYGLFPAVLDMAWVGMAIFFWFLLTHVGWLLFMLGARDSHPTARLALPVSWVGVILIAAICS